MRMVLSAQMCIRDSLSMMPIYFGVDDANEGLAVGTENHWTVHAKADQKDIDATLEFLKWVITSDDGRDAVSYTHLRCRNFQECKEAGTDSVRAST